MIDLRKLHHLITVIDLGSFVRAAAFLNMSQPALSRSIQALEANYGTPLIERVRGDIRATVIGRQLIQESRPLVHDAHRLHNDLYLWAGGESGSLSFGMGALAATIMGSHLLSTFKQRRPSAQVHLELAEPEKLEAMLNGYQVEFVVIGQAALTNIAKLKIIPVMSVPISLLVRPDHPLAHKESIDMMDLAPYPLACGSHTEDESRGLKAPPADIICENYEVLREVTLTSNAVLLSSPLHADKKGSTALVELPRPGDSYFEDAYELVIAHLDHRMSPLAQLAVDIILTAEATPGARSESALDG